MAHKTKGFVVASGRRPSGTPYWTVRGSIGGKQVRKEFADRAEALAWQEKKNSELFGHADVVQGSVLTRLAPAQVREAETVFAQLEHDFPGVRLFELMDYYRVARPNLPVEDVQRFAIAFERLRKKHSQANLADVCDFFLATYRPDTSGITLATALDHYAVDVDRRHTTGALSWWQQRSIRFALGKFERHFPADTPLAHITTSQLHEYLVATSKAKDGSTNYSNKTWNNRRG